MKGKTIRLYLVDGTATGTLTAEIINWTGKVLVVPRSQLADAAKREEARRTGVYLLVGPDPDTTGQDAVYVGEGDSVATRLAHHDKDDSKDFWSRTVIVVSKDDNITKAHGRYLESRLIDMISKAGRARLMNSAAPVPPPLPESEIADMEGFLDQMRLVLPAIGFSFLHERPSVEAGPSELASSSPIFELNRVGASARAREIDGEFVVSVGSTARREGVESWTSYKGLREQLIEAGKLTPDDDPELFVFGQDVPFASPSAAASVIMARNANGRKEWRVAGTSTTFREWQNESGTGADS
ncbi:MAG: GIY-YIG nuclease family protein [Planctomycetota bacterium]